MCICEFVSLIKAFENIVVDMGRSMCLADFSFSALQDLKGFPKWHGMACCWVPGDCCSGSERSIDGATAKTWKNNILNKNL